MVMIPMYSMITRLNNVVAVALVIAWSSAAALDIPTVECALPLMPRTTPSHITIT